VCHNTHILVKGKMKKDEKNEEKKRMNPWFYAIFWLSRQKLASADSLAPKSFRKPVPEPVLPASRTG